MNTVTSQRDTEMLRLMVKLASAERAATLMQAEHQRLDRGQKKVMHLLGAASPEEVIRMLTDQYQRHE